MYLLIYANGCIRQIDEPGEPDYYAAEQGDLEIVDISDCDAPVLYVHGDWEAVTEADEES